jgi:hypothetical protein
MAEEDPEWFVNLRDVIVAAISSSVPQIESRLGLEQPSSRFRYDLSKAILFCALTQKFPPERHSQIARKLRVISKDAAAAERIGRKLISHLAMGSGIYPPLEKRFLLKLQEYTSECASLSAMAAAHARALKDPGGQRGFVAFRTLVDHLISAFESAAGTTASVTYNPIEEIYTGTFLDFMREVVAVMQRLFPEISYPTSGLAVDNFIYKRVSSLRSKSSKERERKKRTRSYRRPRTARGRNVQRRLAHRGKRLKRDSAA